MTHPTDTPTRPAAVTDAELAELRQLEQAAKPAPWRLERDNQDMRLVSDADPEICCWTFLVRPWMPDDWDECDLTDQHLIVAMRNALPRLLDALTATQAALAEAQREREALARRAIELAGQAMSARGLLRLVAMSPDDPPLPALLTAIEAELNAGESVDSPPEPEATHDPA